MTFVKEYSKLIRLLNQEWGYQEQRPTGGPGANASFENIELFVRGRLNALARDIKELEAIDIRRNEVGFDVKEKALRLRAEFRRAFDILKPFGLVYPSYDPYFDPEGSYFYG